jgi:plastocyanin
VYSNGWASATDANSFGGFVKLSTASGNTAAETFNGHNVAWVARRGPAAGIATVQIDGGAGIYVKLTATSVQERRIVFTRARLTVPGGHTVKVTNLGTGGTAHEVNVDSFLWLS